ncbi:MAG: aminoacyl-tRNA hydrolase [Candidatus Moranbacteria bacterium]|jgi:PTH1 family peptidyl-tRNA hydrolase|nr:aminoacyl-tRNA hydrolase [Candidatus Moranbacteria bacterium]MDX9855676.1 aminoacyl-tRNA hydrolase [Candidatus Moranbacteria bacterium]
MSDKNHRLIIGLGNPGERYSRTRHNAGFIILDELQKRLNFSDFRFEKKFNVEMAEKIEIGNIRGGFLKKLFQREDASKTLLMKPLSFMNKSGEAIKKIMDFYKIPPKNITVIHDDLDIKVGNFKISENSGSAGHNGIQNIIDRLGTQEFKRIRIGVEKKGGRQSRQVPGNKFILQEFSEEELEKIKDLANKLENLIG